MKNKNSLIYIILLFVVSASFAVFIYPTESQFEYSYEEGVQWLYDDFYSPYDFAIQRSEEDIKAEKDSITAAFIPFYYFDTTALTDFVTSYRTKFSNVLHEHIKICSDSNFIFSDLLISKPCLSQRDADMLCNNVGKKLNSIYNKGVLRQYDENKYKNAGNKIRLLRNNVSNLEIIDELYTADYVRNEIMSCYKNSRKIQEADSAYGYYLRDFIEETDIAENITIDEDQNQQYLKSKLESVMPTSGIIHKGDLIIAKGKTVDAYSKQLLDSYKLQSKSAEGSRSTFFTKLGVSIIFVILFLIIFFYSLSFKKKGKWGIKEIIFLLSQMLLLFSASYVIFAYTQLSVNIIPFVLIPILLITFIDFDFSLLVYFITIFVVSFFAVNRFEFLFVQVVTGLIGMLSFRLTSKRKQIFITMLVVFATYSVLNIGFSLMRNGSISADDISNFINYGISSAMILLYLPFLYVCEKIFGFISGFTLMELCDTNNAVLRELSEKAPGSFQHSIMLSNMVDSVVREIGGKHLLARTGALYHDIGKLYAPQYFIENQNGGKNIHDTLEYEDSAQKIIAHVSKGVELAKKHKLPPQIVDFIKQHHGTTVTRYFYNSWKNANPGQTPDMTKFQYAGPKPQSLELIVMMMADAVEAASRTLKVYSHETISSLVNNIIDSQFRDGQYEEVDITMKQIGTAKKVLISKIENIYHSRIEYPELKDDAKQ